jgi:uncharacterized membrane protein YsdA (DUF1294 family)
MVISIIGLILWVAVFNVVGMIMLMNDKKRARRHMRRIPEKRLLWIGWLGGAPLMLVTMYLIHHKTHRKKFTIGFPIAIVVMAAVLLYMWNNPDQFHFYWTVFTSELQE